MSVEKQNFKVGDTVELGTWAFDSRGNMRKISWLIIDKFDDGTGLLMTKYGIDTKKFNNDGGSTNWEECSLRKWLNEDFLSQAFTEKESEGIMPSTIETPNKKGLMSFLKKTITTKDLVFLLSAEEAETFFANDGKRKTLPTAWALQNLAYCDEGNDKACWWWLRSPGKSASRVACVCVGSVNEDGELADFSGNSIRPVIKFNLNIYEQIMQEEQQAQ